MQDNTFSTNGFPKLILRSPHMADQTEVDLLYQLNRQDLHALPMPPDMIATFIRQQQQFQTIGFTRNYPQAQTLLLTTPDLPGQGGQVLARVVFDHGPQTIHLIDIMVHPMVHRRGLARQLLRYLQNTAKTHQLPISLQVMKDNHVALALYASCAFQIIKEDYLSAEMRWIPTPQHSS